MSTETYLTVEQALRGWANGETIQCRPKNGSHGWEDYTVGIMSTTLDATKFDYRFKPKPREFYALPTGTVDVGSESPVEVVRLYEYHSDAQADKEQYGLKGEIIHVREVLPE